MPDQRVDVAIVGDGLAAMLVERALRGAAITRRWGDPLGPWSSGRSTWGLGIAAAGAEDNPLRLVSALGEDAARDLWGWSHRSCLEILRLAESLGVPCQRGVLRVPLDAVEAQEWTASRELLTRWGLPWEEVRTGDHVALRLAGDGSLDAAALQRALTEVGGISGPPAVGWGEDGDGPWILDSEGRTRAEIVVFACGAGGGTLSPFLQESSFPVRVTTTVWLSQSTPPEAVLYRHRWETLVPTPRGFSLQGCRWAAQPEMEAGEEDASVLNAPVIEAQQKMAPLLVPGAVVDGASAEIVRLSCDGLPILGPQPGRPRVVLLWALGAWPLSWAASAAAEVSKGILGGHPDIPWVLRSARMGG